MLFRALFWIGVVALFMPRTGLDWPDGAPATSNSRVATSLPGDFRDSLFDRLANVRVEIERAEQSRGSDTWAKLFRD
jgi:hypothetical protein